MYVPRLKVFSKKSSALLLIMAASSTAQAAVFTHTEGFSVIGNEHYSAHSYFPYPSLIEESNLSSLPQFNASQGTLESVTISINGSLSFDSYFEAQGVSDPSSGFGANARFNIGVGLRSWIDGTATLEAYDSFDKRMSCSGGAGRSNCNSWERNSFDVNTSVMFTGTDVDNFIGSGDLGTSSSLNLYASLNSPMHIYNLNNAFLRVDPIQFDGDVTVEYTTSAVPVPAAVWLFGSALAGLGFTRRRKT